MKLLPSFDPTTAPAGTIPVGIVDQNSKVVLYNESAVTLQINFEDGSTDVLHAWEAKAWSINYVTPSLSWSSLRNLAGAGQSPASQVDTVVYGPTEKVEGTFPAQLTRLVSQGNVQVGGAVSNIVNDGNAANTSVVEATQTGSSGSNVQLDNSGNLTLKQYSAATLTQIFQVVANAGAGNSNVFLSDSNHVCEVIGSLLVDIVLHVVKNAFLDGNLQVLGTSLFVGDATFNGAGNGVTIANNAQVNGNVQANGTLQVTHASTTENGLQMQNSSGQTIDVLYVNAANNTVLLMGGSSQKIFFETQAGTKLASIDSSGNMRLKGSLTQNTTP